MATNTTKLALTKPDGTDLVDIAVLNANADKIDAASGATICTSSTRPASPFNGQLIFETDTLNVLVYRTSTTSWNIVGGSTVASDPPAGAGNGNFWWDSDNGKLYIYYNDGNSSQWVSVMPSTTAVDVARNAIINGDFNINQRSFTSTTTSGTYGFDRWYVVAVGGTSTYSAQTFTPGVAPVTGYEARNYARIITSGQSAAGDLSLIAQQIEDVRTLANQTITVSFWAKANSGTPAVAVELSQLFGSGGSPSSEVNTFGGKVTLSTSWTRYAVTLNLPSLSGKTIGTTANTSSLRLNLFISAGSDLNSRTGSIGIQSNTFDFWGVQVEKGAIATSFKTATGTLQGELAACQRYYWRAVAESSFGYFGMANAYSTNNAMAWVQHPVVMRTAATSVEWNGTGSNYMLNNGASGYNLTSFALNAGDSSSRMTAIAVSATGPTAGTFWRLMPNAATTAYIGISAEL